MKFWSKKFFFCISLAMVLALFAGCQATTPPVKATPSPIPPPAAVEAPPLKVTLPTTLPAMMGILRTRIYFTGSGYLPNEMVVVEMEVPPGVEITGVKPGERVGVAYAPADEKGNFTANVEAMTKITTFLRGSFLPTLAPDPKSFNPLPHGVYTFVASGVDSGRSGIARIEFVPPK